MIDQGEGRGKMFMVKDYIPWLSWFTRLNGLDAKLKNLAKGFDDFLDIVV